MGAINSTLKGVVMITVNNIYQNLIAVKKRKGLYQIEKINCKSGEIEIFASNLNETDLLEIERTQKFVRIPHYIFCEEAKCLKKYLKKAN